MVCHEREGGVVRGVDQDSPDEWRVPRVERRRQLLCNLGFPSRLGIAVNDMVVLDDRDWPANLQGLWLGRITSIHPQPSAPLVADIRVEPVSDLMRLKEVMVMVK